AVNTGASIVGSRHSPHRQTVTKKTRVYVVDGVQMTSTSHQVFGVKQDYELSHIPRYHISLYGDWSVFQFTIYLIFVRFSVDIVIVIVLDNDTHRRMCA
ncbi:unnamed protein product, partial [Onchocerca flexuosa]|uniref:Guanylate cyclase domain-containing protein n=1 Tax=Onchocerca flexuosa TaxID=387005 RepID=A0A183HVU7_9BILA